MLLWFLKKKCMNELEKIFFNQLHVIINIMNNIIFPLFITFNAIIFYLYFLRRDINNSNILYKILRKRKKEIWPSKRKFCVWMDRVWRSIHKLAKYFMIHVFVNASKYFDYSWRRGMSHDIWRKRRRGRLGIASSNLKVSQTGSWLSSQKKHV